MAIKKWIIYKITNPKGKIYIGKTVDFDRRLDEYRKKCEPKQRLLYRSFVKYKFENHNIEIIEDGILNNALSSEREKYWIQLYKCNENRWRNGVGLNLTDGGEGTAGLKHRKKTKKMIDNMKERMTTAFGKSIVQYDLSGNVIKEFKAMRLAAIELGISRTTLKNIINKKTAYTYLPYIIKRQGEPFLIDDIKIGVRGRKVNPHINNSHTLITKYGKPITQFTKAGEPLKDFPSITVAAKQTGIIRQSIYSNLVGKSKAVKGYIFKYKGEQPEKGAIPKVETYQ